MDEFVWMVLTGFVCFVIGGFVALYDQSQKRGEIREQIARGEIACEYYRSELICWNPKEEEK